MIHETGSGRESPGTTARKLDGVILTRHAIWRAGMMMGMNKSRSEWPLVAMWFCVAYFGLVFAFQALSYISTPLNIVSDYDPSKMTKDDLMAIARSIGKGLWINAMLTIAGTVALIATAVWLQSTRASRL
jgi:hypothetical protein